MKLFFALSLVVCGLAITLLQVSAAMTSTNYLISWDNLNSGGNESATSTNFAVYDTVGQPVSGSSTSTNYSVEAGYRAVGDTTLSFVARGQTALEVAYSNISIPATSVVVADASGFSVGDYIAVVEDKGFDALVTIGKITTIVGSLITVDSWQGEQALMAAAAVGGDDYVYRIASNTSVSLGTITPGEEKVALAGISLFSSATSGHTVYVQGAGILSHVISGTEIAAVSDGTVSSNAEEYGAEAVGPHAADATTDLGVTTTQRVILTSTVPAMSAPDRLVFLFKLGVTAGTLDGNYAQTVYFTLTSNF